MKYKAYPTVVNLKELEDTEEFHYSRSGGELNNCLKDLINANPYDIQIQLRPMGNAFEITGKIDTQLNRVCSRCGRDTICPIKDEFNELIVVLKERPRAGHSGHTGSHEAGPFCNYVTGYEFDLGEFSHEHIAASEPYAPLCGQLDCEHHFKLASERAGLATEHNKLDSPFGVLKNLTVKSQRG